MTVTVRFFALLRDKVGAAQARANLPAGATVADAAAWVAERHPEAAGILRRCAFAVNLERANAGHSLQDGDEVAMLPPVSGG